MRPDSSAGTAVSLDSSRPRLAFCRLTLPLRMASVGVLVTLLGLVVLSNSQCVFEALKASIDNPPKGCVDKDGAEHEFGSEWLKDCMDCFCTHEGLSCCDKLPDKNADIPEDCELLLDKEHCSAKVVLKSDRTKECMPI